MQSKLPLSRILLYSSASIGLNIMAITVSTWLLYFYAPPPDSGRPQYLPLALIGPLLMVAGLWDAIIDPFIGHWSDNLRSRWGRRRPFLMFATPPAAISLVLIWLPPSGSTALTAIYMMVIILFFYTTYSLVGIPYDGTMPELAPTTSQRVVLSGWKNVFGIVGVMIGALLAGPLFASIGPAAMGLVVAVVGLLTIWLALFGLKETERPIGEPIKLIDGMRATFKNTQFVFLFISTLLIHTSYGMLMANLPYFVTLVAGKTETDVNLYQGIVVVTMVVFVPLWSWLGRRVSNRVLLFVCMLGLAVVSALTFLAGSATTIPAATFAMVAMALVGPFLGGYFVLIYSMMGNVVDYDEMITNRRREAIYYGTFSLAAGIGPSISALVLPFVLQQFGYTTANPLGVRVAFLVMALFCALGTLMFLPYKLGDTPEETRRNLGIVETARAAD